MSGQISAAVAADRLLKSISQELETLAAGESDIKYQAALLLSTIRGFASRRIGNGQSFVSTLALSVCESGHLSDTNCRLLLNEIGQFGLGADHSKLDVPLKDICR